MDRQNLTRKFAGVIFLMIAQNLQKMWHNEMMDLDSDDDEEENVTTLHMFSSMKENATRIEGYVERTVSRQTEKEFQSHFRLSYAAFEALENKLGPELNSPTSQGTSIPIRKQLLCILWLLATPDSFRSVGEKFNLSKGGIYLCFTRVVEALNKLADSIIKWPSTAERAAIKDSFQTFGGLKNVIGAIDGAFIEIKAPKEHAHVYTCRKCFYAMQLQAIAIPSLKFTDIFTGYPGSVGDRRVFCNSIFYKNVNSNKMQYFGEGEYILGDKAYPALTWCVPPYINRGTQTETEINFNEKHAKTRQVIERAFALLFGRYRRLKYLDMNKVELTPATILAACVLHNICLDHSDLDFDEQAISEGEAYMASQQNILLADRGEARDNVTVDVLNDVTALTFRDNLAENLR